MLVAGVGELSRDDEGMYGYRNLGYPKEKWHLDLN